VGASLLAIGLAQLASLLTGSPPSLAGQLPQGVWAGYGNLFTPPAIVGASLLAMGSAQLASSLIDPPPSLAGQLPQGSVLFKDFVTHAKPCGNWLASDEASKTDRGISGLRK
jgi:hypothetical protein